jgi:deazaflavin-dependent oxidoreductase (nitroreductase family)
MRFPAPNAVQRAIWPISSSRPRAWLLARSLPQIDKLERRITRGQMTLTGATGGIPVLTITTTGTRSGRRRTAPLDGLPFADGIAIIGAYFGQLGTPGWYYNLRARLKWYITRWDLEEPAAAQDYLAEALSCSELERTS